MLGCIFQLDDKGTSGSGVPSPVDGSSTVWPADYWATLYPQLSAAGVSVFKLPPLCKGASLGAGFDPFDHYDWGSKRQSGRRQTRFGSREQIQRNIAIGYRNGMEPAAHLVHHHLDGANKGPFTYQYLGADGKTFNGRFPKDPNCFWTKGSQNPDTVPSPQWDLGFGNEFEWLSGTYGDGQGLNGPGYVGRNLIAAAKAQLLTFGIRQLILDDLKGTSANYIAWLCNTLWQDGFIDFVGGEYFEGARDILNNYITSPPISNACGCFDFSQRFADQNWCNAPGGYDMHQMLWNGLWWLNPPKALGFLDDLDTVGSEPVWRIWQGNAALLTKPSYPMIFGKHCYPASRGGFGLMNQLLNLAWFRAKFIAGPLTVRAVDYNYFVYEYPQAPGALIALGNRAGNFNNPSDWTQVTVQTAWWPGTHLHNYSGLTNDAWVDNNGRVTIWIPPSDDSGRAFVTYAQAGHNGPINLPERITKQTFFGAADLDSAAATAVGARTTYIWSDLNKVITLSPDQGSAEYSVTDEHGNTIIPQGAWQGETKARGWHRITAFSTTGTPVPYSVTVHYWGTRDLQQSEFGDPIEISAADVIQAQLLPNDESVTTNIPIGAPVGLDDQPISDSTLYDKYGSDAGGMEAEKSIAEKDLP